MSSILDAIDMDSINVKTQNEDCRLCGATYCAACHVNIVDPNDIKNDWLKCVSREDRGRCQLMKIFGQVNRMMRLVLASRGLLMSDK